MPMIYSRARERSRGLTKRRLSAIQVLLLTLQHNRLPFIYAAVDEKLAKRRFPKVYLKLLTLSSPHSNSACWE